MGKHDRKCGTKAFRSLNRQLTAMWGAAFTLMIPAHIAAGVIDTHRANVWLNWAVPILLITLVVKRTAAVSQTAADDDVAVKA